jgi:hypothetical protein
MPGLTSSVAHVDLAFIQVGIHAAPGPPAPHSCGSHQLRGRLLQVPDRFVDVLENFAARAIEAGDTSAAALAAYEVEWGAGPGRKMERNYRLREKFVPQERTDERFLRASMLAAK